MPTFLGQNKLQSHQMTETEAELTLRGLGYVRVVNELLEYYRIPYHVFLVEDINYDVFVALYECLVGQSLLEVFGANPNEEDRVANLNSIVEALSSVLSVQLDHIRASAIVNEKDRTAICNLVEIFEFAASLFPGTLATEISSWRTTATESKQHSEHVTVIEQEPIVEPLDRDAVLRSRLVHFLTTNRDAFNELERYHITERSVSASARQRESRIPQRPPVSARPRARPRSADSNASSRRTFTIESDDDRVGKFGKRLANVARAVPAASSASRVARTATASAVKKQQPKQSTSVKQPKKAAPSTRDSAHSQRPVSNANAPATRSAARLRSRSAAAGNKREAVRTVTGIVEHMYSDRLRDFRQELTLNLDARRSRVNEQADNFEALKRAECARSARATKKENAAPVTRKQIPATTSAKDSRAKPAKKEIPAPKKAVKPRRAASCGRSATQISSIRFEEPENAAPEEKDEAYRDPNPWRLLEDDLPHMQVSSELVNRLYAKYIDLLQSASRQLRSSSTGRAAKTRVRDAVVRYRRFLESVETGLRNETRRSEMLDARRMQIAQRNTLTQKRIESIRMRRYFTDYYLRVRAEFARRKADFDENLFRRFFVQLIAKYRQDLASFVRSRRDALRIRTERSADSNEARDAFFSNEAQLALDAFRSQRSALETNERVYRVELASLKKSLRDRMRSDIERMQDAVRVELGQVAEHFREADVHRILTA